MSRTRRIGGFPPLLAVLLTACRPTGGSNQAPRQPVDPQPAMASSGEIEFIALAPGDSQVSVSRCAVTLAHFVRVLGRPPARGAHQDWRVKGSPDAPATGVTWEEAAEFCRALSASQNGDQAGPTFRLPTVTEWDRFHRVNPKDPGCFSYWTRPLHWQVWEWCSDDDGGRTERLFWSHPDPFISKHVFRVVRESGGFQTPR